MLIVYKIVKRPTQEHRSTEILESLAYENRTTRVQWYMITEEEKNSRTRVNEQMGIKKT